MPFTMVRAVIFGKTYPEPSKRYYETVCTGALRESDGRPIRLYPVPLRYLNDESQYALWDRIEVPIDRNSSDSRPESFKIDPAKLKCLGKLPSDKQEWAARRELVDRSPDWHFDGMADLLAKHKADKTSIGLVRPGSIERVELADKPAGALEEFRKKCEELRQRKESDMFDPEYRDLDFLEKEIFLHWVCRVPCATCTRQPHRFKVLDWGLLQLARKRSWELAVQHLGEISDPAKHDFRLFLGNMAQHPSSFLVIALWYPQRQAQGYLF